MSECFSNKIYIVLLTLINHHILSGVRCAEYGNALNCASCHRTYGEQGSCGKDCVILNNDFSQKQDLATEQCVRRGNQLFAKAIMFYIEIHEIINCNY